MSRRVPWELMALVIAAGVGAVDATVGGQTDLAVVFVVTVLLGLVALVRSWGGRRTVVLRADLTAWLSRRAADRGSSLDDEASHAVAAFRAGLVTEPDS